MGPVLNQLNPGHISYKMCSFSCQFSKLCLSTRGFLHRNLHAYLLHAACRVQLLFLPVITKEYETWYKTLLIDGNKLWNRVTKFVLSYGQQDIYEQLLHCNFIFLLDLLQLISAETLKLKWDARELSDFTKEVGRFWCAIEHYKGHPCSVWQPHHNCSLRYKILKRNSILLWNVKTDGGV